MKKRFLSAITSLLALCAWIVLSNFSNKGNSITSHTYNLYSVDTYVVSQGVYSLTSEQIEVLPKTFIRCFGYAPQDIAANTLIAGFTTADTNDDITAEEVCPTSVSGYVCLIEVKIDGVTGTLSIIDFISGDYCPF